jgi:hypothetical protein
VSGFCSLCCYGIEEFGLSDVQEMDWMWSIRLWDFLHIEWDDCCELRAFRLKIYSTEMLWGLQIVAKLSKDLAAKIPNIKTTGQVWNQLCAI